MPIPHFRSWCYCLYCFLLLENLFQINSWSIHAELAIVSFVASFFAAAATASACTEVTSLFFIKAQMLIDLISCTLHTFSFSFVILSQLWIFYQMFLYFSTVHIFLHRYYRIIPPSSAFPQPNPDSISYGQIQKSERHFQVPCHISRPKVCISHFPWFSVFSPYSRSFSVHFSFFTFF